MRQNILSIRFSLAGCTVAPARFGRKSRIFDKISVIFSPSVDRWEKRIIMNATEQSMIEARERSVAPFSDAAGTAGAKGFTAEGYPFSRTDMPGPV